MRETSAVRCAVTAANERWMAASVSLATADVASSSTRTAGSRGSLDQAAYSLPLTPDRVTRAHRRSLS